MSCGGKTATRAPGLGQPPNGTGGLLACGEAICKADTQAAAADGVGGQQQAGSTACVAAETGVAQAAALPTADDGNGSYADCGGATVVKLLAHTVGGLSVRQAVLHHFSQCPQLRCIAVAPPGDSSDHIGDKKTGQLQVPTSDLPATAADVGNQLQDGSARSRPVAVLAVGPEGGWTPSEVTLLTQQHAFQTVTTAGGRTLDTTTAIVSLLSLVCEAMTELQ